MAEIKTLVKQLRAAKSRELRDHLVEEIAHEHGERVIAAAVKAGKIAAADVPTYRQMFKDDPASARRLLTAPVIQGGLAARSQTPGARQDLGGPGAYPQEWVAAEARPKGRSRVTNEDVGASRPAARVRLGDD
jgi:crotonobetainyl-CoA:carnitine CoA-transferase CaiB-like acyl-CoA transferase